MDREGTIYTDEDPPEEDMTRLREWADDIEEEEAVKEQKEKIREFEETHARS